MKRDFLAGLALGWLGLALFLAIVAPMLDRDPESASQGDASAEATPADARAAGPDEQDLAAHVQTTTGARPRPADAELWLVDPLAPEVIFRVPSRHRDLLIMHVPRVPWRICYGERCVSVMRIAEVVMQEGEPR